MNQHQGQRYRNYMSNGLMEHSFKRFEVRNQLPLSL